MPLLVKPLVTFDSRSLEDTLTSLQEKFHFQVRGLVADHARNNLCLASHLNGGVAMESCCFHYLKNVFKVLEGFEAAIQKIGKNVGEGLVRWCFCILHAPINDPVLKTEYSLLGTGLLDLFQKYVIPRSVLFDHPLLAEYPFVLQEALTLISQFQSSHGTLPFGVQNTLTELQNRLHSILDDCSEYSAKAAILLPEFYEFRKLLFASYSSSIQAEQALELFMVRFQKEYIKYVNTIFNEKILRANTKGRRQELKAAKLEFNSHPSSQPRIQLPAIKITAHLTITECHILWYKLYLSYAPYIFTYLDYSGMPRTTVFLEETFGQTTTKEKRRYGQGNIGRRLVVDGEFLITFHLKIGRYHALASRFDYYMPFLHTVTQADRKAAREKHQIDLARARSHFEITNQAYFQYNPLDYQLPL